MSIKDTLKDRKETYGNFLENATISQSLQSVMRGTLGWDQLARDQREALSVIALKISRILSGNPNYTDNWHDIQGYAKLVEDRLNWDVQREANGPTLFERAVSDLGPNSRATRTDRMA